MIDLLPGEDQQALLDSFQDFLRDEAAGPVAGIWNQIAGLGWLSLSLPEVAGGAGLGPAEEMLLLRECGRYLLTPCVMATLAAIHIAHAAGKPELALELAGGVKRAALALPMERNSVYLIDGDEADLMLVVEDEAAMLCESSPDGEPLRASDDRTALSVVDRGREFGRTADMARVRLLVAAQLLGIAEAVRDMAADYAKTRVQFGQPIGAFQAIKHVCADMAIRAEAALAQTSYAALCVAKGIEDPAVEAAAAVRIATGAAIASAEANIQLHGAMGVTEECQAHLYLKRAHLLSHFGSRNSWQTRVLLGS